ncbi:ribosomal protein S7 [Thozetella sp. PMI_491]|nr:ribosomal protein S7 [Thozetella sp. PMI_491]
MPPRVNIWGGLRSLAVRPRPMGVSEQSTPRFAVALVRASPAASTRSLSDDTSVPPRLPAQNQPSGSGPPPSFTNGSFQGSERPAGHELARSAQDDSLAQSENDENSEALRQLELASYGLNPFDPDLVGHKFGLPELPLEKDNHLKHRYSPVIVQLTRLMMRDGKLGKAQRDMAMILNYLRTSPPPKVNPAKPLLPGAPSPSHLPLDPVMYLTLAIDSVAPLITLRYIKGAAGGGRSLEYPQPIEARKRRRMAFKWILDAVAKKQSKGSGRTMFPHRVGEEIVAVVEGRSSVWDKRMLLHKQGTAARANFNHPEFPAKLRPS